MGQANRCQRCDGEFPNDGVLGGHCPRCMLVLGLESTYLDGDVGEGREGDEGTSTTNKAAGDFTIPTSIGRYRILRVIGAGGMGVVYEAEQDQPRRIVALKIIKPGLVSDELLRRFEQESQALGRLQHPGIAQIYEAGTVDTGFGPQPYFAMELITGQSPRDYAESHHLNTNRRLEIMVKICHAVQHAHQRGLIHRDLKPANILVDDTAQPKILDFGVARAMDSDTRSTLQTDVGQLIGTLAYMSPEQTLADPMDIDTRSDVYALGVILYELLAGRLPYMVSKNLHENIRAIREDDPARLSIVNRTYRGDIETIVAKALEKDRTRRYASATEIGSDIQRYLKDEPIVARPPNARYQLQKFARRHKALVAGIGAVFVVLVAGIAVSTSQMVRARRAEDLAVHQRDLAIAATNARDLALIAEQQATQETKLERDKAIAESNRADRVAILALKETIKARLQQERADGANLALIAQQKATRKTELERDKAIAESKSSDRVAHYIAEMAVSDRAKLELVEAANLALRRGQEERAKAANLALMANDLWGPR